MPYDPSSDAGRVRLLINDIACQVYADDEIDAFLDLEGGNVRLAAALALETTAANEALLSKVITTQDLRTDGAAVAKVLLDRAARLREQVASGVAGGDAALPVWSFPEPTSAFYGVTGWV